MGLDNLFGYESDLSDFSNKTAIHFDDILHKAKLEFNMKEGEYTVDNLDLTESKQFICDHPFVFVIYIVNLGQCLFTGIYRDPSQN